ncbi:MAG: ABC transporter substrate-binding protein [Gammaproteobacteria bacterium]
MYLYQPQKFLVTLFFLGTFFVLTSLPAYSQDPLVVRIAYLNQKKKLSKALSNLDPLIEDAGAQGARLAVSDNNTTGQFTDQKFVLEEVTVPFSEDATDSFKRIIGDGVAFVVSTLPSDQLRKISEIQTEKPVLIFDAGTRDDEFRLRDCWPNVLHIQPSRAMRADALAQFMLKKTWKEWFLVVGPDENDKKFSAALKRSAKRFNMKIVMEKEWTHTFDARRTAQSDVPVFTQGVDYDVLVVADEVGLFGEYLAYRTWKPRPVIGTQGLVPTSWHRTHEQWGAVQIQNRFKEQAGRWMTEDDYAAYLAVRSIGEAATRTRSVDIEKIRPYLLSDQFALQGYKGTPLSFRNWNGQLRQPILLAAERSMVAVAPVEGFLHPVTELDTLGYDRPESQCK